MVSVCNGFVLFIFLLTDLCFLYNDANPILKYVREKREDSLDLGDIFNYAIGDPDAVDDIEDIEDKFRSYIKSLIQPIKTELDKYPDNYNKTFSDVKNENGTRIETSKTIYKESNNGSSVGYIAKTKHVDGQADLKTVIKLQNLALKSTGTDDSTSSGGDNE